MASSLFALMDDIATILGTVQTSPGTIQWTVLAGVAVLMTLGGLGRWRAS